MRETFIVWIVFILLKQKKTLKSHEKVCKNKDFCGIVMSPKKRNMLKFNQYSTSDKTPYIFYADIESLIKKIDGCSNKPEKSSTTKIGAHISCEYSLSTILPFDHIENKHTLYQEEDCMKKFCESLREDVKYIIDFEKKNMPPSTKKEIKTHQDAKVCYICGKKILKKLTKSKDCRTVRDHGHHTGKHRSAAYSICNLRFNVPI